MEVINNFEKGLHRSNSPITQPEGSYPDAINWVRNDEGRLLNEELEEIVSSYPKELMGYTILNAEAICLFADEIGIFDKVTKTYTTLINTPFSDITSSVEAKARVGLYGNRLLYFVEKDKYIRRVDLDNLTAYTTIDDYQLQLDFQLPEISNVTINTSGNLPTGVYYLAARYMTEGGNKTATGLISEPIYIVDGIKNNNTDNYDGAPPNSPSNKSITFNVTNNDTTYPYVEILVATYEGITNVLTSYSLGTYNNNTSNITFSDVTQFVDRVPLTDLTTNPTFYEGAGSIEQKDNILILSNLKVKQRDTDIQELVNDIRVLVVPKYIPQSNNITLFNKSLNSTLAPIASTGTIGDIIVDTATNNDTQSSKSEAYIKDFQRGETYSFALTPIYTDGSLGFAYPIKAKYSSNINGFATTYESGNSYSQKYPDNYGSLAGLNVINHKIPDVDEYPLYKDGNLIQLTLNFVNIDLSSKPDIVGYVIGYQKRDSSLNTSILTEGIIRPFMVDNDTSSKFWCPFLTGANRAKDNTNKVAKSQVFQKDYSFLSPDIIHGKEIEGTRIRTIGKQKIFSSTIGREGTSSGSQMVEFSFTHPTDDFVVDTKEGDIIETLDIPNLPFGTTPYNYTVNGTGFNVRGTKGYKHISSSSTLITQATDLQASDLIQDYYLDKGEWSSLQTTDRTITNTSFNVFIGRIMNNQYSSGIQYGRLENAEYCPLGYSLDKTVQSIIVGGDTFTQKYAFDVCEGVHDDLNLDDPTGVNGYWVVRGIMYLYIQSQNNYSYKHYELGEVPYYPKYKTLYSSVEPLGLGNIDHTKGYSTGYNRQYSAVNDLRRSVPKPLLFQEVVNYPNRSIYSEQAFEGELEDSYRVFLPNSFHDIPKNKGEIIDTFVYNNTFYHHTERSLFKSFFNPNTTQATSEGEVILGNAGIFRLPSIELFTQDGGYVGTTTKAGINTPFGRILLDNHQGKVFLLSEGINEISDNGLFSYFRELINPDSRYVTTYDFKNKRLLLCNTTTNEAISYYPKTNTWTSRHSFTPKFYISIDRDTFAWNTSAWDTSFYQLENSNDVRKNTTITIVTNNNPNEFKRFERAEINTMSGGVGGISNPGTILDDNYTFKKNTFTSIQCWNERQNSTELPLEIFNDYLDYAEYYNNKIPVQYFKGDFKLELPLDAVIDADKNIFNPTNVDTTQSFKQPFTSKYLYTKLTYNNQIPLVLSYIKIMSNLSDY